MRRYEMLKHTLRGMGISERRVRLVWASAAEATILAKEIDDMVEDLRVLGPLDWQHNVAEPDHLDEVERILHEHAEAMEVAR
jgi:hypothetical protein